MRRIALVAVLAFVFTGTALGSGTPRAVPHVAPAWWVHGSFATCVRWRESRDGADPNAIGNLYAIQGPRAHGNFGDYGWLTGVPRAEQDWIAWRLYQRLGVQPWRPWDHC